MKTASIFFALLLAGAATLLGVVSAFQRTVANPQYYASAINQVSLTGFAVPLAEKLTGQNGKVAQVLQLGINRLEPQLKQQTVAYLQQLFQYVRGETEKFDLVYDMTALYKDAQAWLTAADRWLFISAGLCLLFVTLIFLAARSIASTLTTIAVALLVAAGLLMLPWIFSEAILATMRLQGPPYELLQQTGLWRALAGELSKSYLISPMTAAATEVACLFGGIAMRRSVAEQ